MKGLWIALLILLAQQTPPPASVQGIVSRPMGGGPISGARVDLIRTDGSSPQTYSSTTGPDGAFLISNARPGLYRIAASRNGFLRREFGQRSRTGSGLTVSLEASQKLQSIQIELRPTAVISGRVRDPQGDAVGATEVMASIPFYQNGQRTLRIVQSTITNDLGEYRLFGLDPGRYYISAMAAGNSTVTALIVSGSQVTAARASPPLVSNPAVYFPGTTDSRNSTPVDVPLNGGEFGGVDITIVSPKTHHIRGVVSGGMANVILWPDDPGAATAIQNVSASSGPFDIANVMPGEYMLIARSGELLGLTHVSLGDNDLDGVTLGLSSTVHVPTHVMLDDRKPGDTGDDPDLENIVFNLLSDPLLPGPPADVYGPFSNGNLSLGVLLHQDYRIANLEVRIPAGGSLPPRLRNVYFKSIRMGATDVMNDGFRVDDAENILPIEIIFGTRSGSISGTVLDDRQRPGANATVVLVPDASRRRWPDSLRTVTTDIAGRFSIGRIAPGKYFLFSWEEVDDGAWTDPEFMKKYEGRGNPIVVNEGENTVLNFTQN